MFFLENSRSTRVQYTKNIVVIFRVNNLKLFAPVSWLDTGFLQGSARLFVILVLFKKYKHFSLVVMMLSYFLCYFCCCFGNFWLFYSVFVIVG